MIKKLNCFGLYLLLVSSTYAEPIEPPSIVNYILRTAGDDVTFEIEATGGSLGYQWYWQGRPIDGATAATLTFADAARKANAGYYSVQVTNELGEAITPPPGLLFTKPVLSGTYSGMFAKEEAPAVETSGLFDFKISKGKRSYTGKVYFGGETYRFSGAFDEAHASQTQATAKSGRTLEVSLQLVSTTDDPGVIGEIVVSQGEDHLTIPLKGSLVTFSSRSPAPQTGTYTMAMLNTNLIRIGESPSGVGFATLNVSKSGGVKMFGRTADGVAFTHSRSVLSKNGSLPVFVPLYQNRGALTGWIDLDAAADAGELNWVKGAFDDRSYPEGFQQTLQASVSRYFTREYPRDWQRPGLTVDIPFTEATATFTGGDMFSDDLALWDFVPVYVSSPHRFTAQAGPEKLSLKINPRTGQIWGRFTHFLTGKPTPISGILLQGQGQALGHFLSTDSSGHTASGYFALEPN